MPPPPFKVRCDRERMMQVFSNLIGNAVKFVPERGTIVLSATASGANALVAVRDTGPGIPRRAPAPPVPALLAGRRDRAQGTRPRPLHYQRDCGGSGRRHLGGEPGRRRIDFLHHSAAGYADRAVASSSLRARKRPAKRAPARINWRIEKSYSRERLTRVVVRSDSGVLPKSCVRVRQNRSLTAKFFVRFARSRRHSPSNEPPEAWSSYCLARVSVLA